MKELEHLVCSPRLSISIAGDGLPGLLVQSYAAELSGLSVPNSADAK
jgi:hypothetical protein